jgi:IMP dehydrogenase
MGEKDKFFGQMERLRLALTFDDVRLKTAHSTVMPDDIDVSTRFSRNVPLKIPIVSAAMDCVTEHKLAIELAKLGGIGIIHRNLSPEQQSMEVKRVKYHLNGLIEKPICVQEDETIGEILDMKKNKGYGFSTFPVLKGKKFVGLLTQNDFDFCTDHNKPAKEVMTKDVITTGKDTSLDKAYEIMIKNKKKVLPLVNEGTVHGMYVFSDLMRIKSGYSTMYNLDDKGQLRVGAAVGVGKDALARIELLMPRIDVAVIDTAHGDTKKVIKTLHEMKKRYPSLDVVAGNTSEAESAERLIKAGADGIKVGQGPGSICTTRIIAGIGMPQVTAIYNTSKVADKYGIPICGDGGIRYSGDITVAIGAGAHSVMLGSLFAGTSESPGETVFLNGRQWKNYRGMGSMSAMLDSKASRERYSQSGKTQIIPEGIEGLVPYRGDLKDMVYQFIGGLKRGMGYVGAANIDELRANADFIRLSSAGQVESHPHDVRITKEAPNYSEV